ncbi:putative membrane protein YkoI [Bacillus pakistanensis]|uniref:Membrane protein YkoI n=1 Tax=Rossellomorea pakistanensis TaxID=992288 RepID=A0ABS2NE59_9BACI|nr:PepSY domain-containing protein [Bacillus pakistanensis]MBM7586145.1 putative membrane protein YkoI [Bacillus pakistanensis]
MLQAHWIRIVGMIIALTLIVLVIWQWTGKNSSTEPLSRAEASELVREKFNGDIVEIETKENKYIISITLDTGDYEVKIDRNNGEIASVTQITSRKEDIEQQLTVEELKEKVLLEQKGEIVKFENEKDHYLAVVEHDSKQTTMKIHPVSGKIIEKSTRDVQTKNPPKRLSEKEAQQIALKQVPGNIDDIELEELNGQTYYLVEIELDEEQEAVVQINAISGEVMTITRDD